MSPDPYMEKLRAIADLEPRLLVRFIEEGVARLPERVRKSETRSELVISRLEAAIAGGITVLQPIGRTNKAQPIANYVQVALTTMSYEEADAAGERYSESYNEAWRASCAWHDARAAELLAEAEAHITNIAPIESRSRLSPLAACD